MVGQFVGKRASNPPELLTLPLVRRNFDVLQTAAIGTEDPDDADATCWSRASKRSHDGVANLEEPLVEQRTAETIDQVDRDCDGLDTSWEAARLRGWLLEHGDTRFFEPVDECLVLLPM